jgi:hypothetical protein
MLAASAAADGAAKTEQGPPVSHYVADCKLRPTVRRHHLQTSVDRPPR